MRGLTSSQQVIRNLQKKYGSANFAQWQGIRKQFYSFVQYPTAGQAEFALFGSAISGTVNQQLTTMPKAGSFGQQHFQLKAIRTSFFLADQKLTSYASTDATTFATEIINGPFQAGYFELIIGNQQKLQLTRPFLYMPPATGQAESLTAGVRALTLTEATPNTLATFDSQQPMAELAAGKNNLFRVDPNIIIEAEQNFQVFIKYPSGAIPITATSVVNDSTNPLYIGVILDGIVFRPQQ